MKSPVKPTDVNPDLAEERLRCSFHVPELTHLLDGGEEKTIERKNRERFFLEDPELKYSVPYEYLSHKEKYEQAVQKACILFRKVLQLQREGKAGMESFRDVLGGQVGSAVLKDGNPFALHYVMFIPTIMGQGTYQQQAEWIQRAWNCEIIGTYAQTELGHGTFIRGLETTATYDTKTKDFIIDSPTLTSYKWWPGGLGHTANYAIVVAQLYTKGQCHGIHPFIVQLRDSETHLPLPGIKIGEIGCKLGMNNANNGYLGFDKVHVPRSNMLMKNNKVLEDGTYVKSPSSKLTYGTMMFVRVVLVRDAADYLKKAVTIAVRYSCVRRQSRPKPDEPEPRIIEYVTQQYKLLPQIATYFAYIYSADWLWDMYNNVSSQLEAGDLDQLPELHAIACCLKAVSTADTATGVEICRLACGGHGYMTCSNLPNTYGLVTAMCTYEGENTVLLLQTARFLAKAWQNTKNGQKMTPTVAYLAENRSNLPFEKSADWIADTLKRVAASKVETACRHLEERIRKGSCAEDAWNETSIELTLAAEAHCRAFVVGTYSKTVSEIQPTVSEALGKVLRNLLNLYSIYVALKLTGDLLRFTNTTGKDIEALQLWLEETLALLRPEAAGVVDAFDISDDVLSSALGAYDGKVYERLFAETSKSPLNAEPVNDSFHAHIKPFLKSNL